MNLVQAKIDDSTVVTDISDISTNLNVGNLCPPENRRDQLETFIKRMAIVIATSLLYGHFNSAVRGVQSPKLRIALLFLFLAHPALPAIEALFLLLQIVWSSFLPQESPSNLRFERSEEDSKDMRVGRLIATGFAAIQCTGTTAMMARRFSHGAATGMDVEMFLYGASALCVALQMLLALIWRGYWVVGDQVLPWHLCTGGTYILLLLLGPSAPPWLLTVSLAVVYLVWGKTLAAPERWGIRVFWTMWGIGHTGFIFWLYWTDWVYSFSTFLYPTRNGPWASWPVDEACPLLWKDPLGDKLVAF